MLTFDMGSLKLLDANCACFVAYLLDGLRLLHLVVLVVQVCVRLLDWIQ